MTGDEDLAHDLTHDTFVLAFERMEQHDGSGSVSAWIYRIAVNLARERERTRRHRADLIEREMPLIATSASDRTGQVEAGLVLEEALAGLPDELRTTLLLHDVDGYTHAEIAEMTGVAEGSSRARLSRARAEMRKALEGRI